MSARMAYLLTWESSHGDEGEGREHVAVFFSEAEAQQAARNLQRPNGFSGEGGYYVTAVPVEGVGFLTPPV